MNTYDYAKQYTDFGLKILKLIPKDKRPAGTWITGTDAYVSPEYYKVNPKYGIGVVSGKASGIAIIDVDDYNNADIYFKKYGIDINSYRKKTASFNRGNENKFKLVFSLPEKEDLTYIDLIHTELRADGKHQDVFPPSIHPDGHKYQWETELKDIIPLPPEIRVIWNIETNNYNTVKEQVKIKQTESRQSQDGENVFDIYNRLVGADTALSYHPEYMRVGNRWAATASKNGPGITVYDGYIISSMHMSSDPMSAYISPSPNGALAYTPFHILWYLDHGGDSTAATAEAYKYCESMGYSFDDPGIIDISELNQRIEEKKSITTIKQNTGIPQQVLSIPGKAQGLVDAFNKSAFIYQPQFAVQTALAITAAFMGRRFKTDRLENYTNFYFEVVGDSSSGKNHCKTFIKSVLSQVDVSISFGGDNNSVFTYSAMDLLSNGEYKSYAGGFTACAKKPAHIIIIDEAGIKRDSQNKSEHGTGVIAFLLDAWSSATSLISKGSYSGGDITLEDIQKEKTAGVLDYVFNPCIVKLGLSTPSTYYNSMKSGDIQSGYLGRHLIVESVFHERDFNIEAKKISECLSKDTIQWLQHIMTAYNYSPNSESFNPNLFMSCVSDPLNPPAPIDMHIPKETLLMFKAEFMSIIEKYGNDNPLVMKGMEMSVRLSMIVAMSCESIIIQPEHAQWAIDYVCYYLSQMVKAAEFRISSSKYEADWKEMYEIILSGGKDGANSRDFERKRAVGWLGATPKQQAELLRTIINAEDIVYCKINNEMGRKRHAWISQEHFDGEIHQIVPYDFNTHRQKTQ